MSETPKHLVKEADRGRSERTPWIALTGVTVAILVLVVVIALVALLFYWVV